MFAKFERPILHGLCSYGITARVIQTKLLPKVVANFKKLRNPMKAIRARFTSHVFPGDTLEFSFWVEKDKSIIAEVKTAERGLAVLIMEISLVNECEMTDLSEA